MIKGVLLDIDGTLILSNDAHAQSWVEAFAMFGYEVIFDDVRQLIGMGGDKLMTALFPELNENEGDGKKIKELRTEILMKKYISKLSPTPGSRQLVEVLQARDVKTVVASSAKKSELEALLTVAKVQDLLTEATTSDDADKSKPDPDIIQVALEKIELPANEVIMIGDTPYDIEAATKAGVRCIAVRSGGWHDDHLAGAVAIYDDPADIMQHLDSIVDL